MFMVCGNHKILPKVNCEVKKSYAVAAYNSQLTGSSKNCLKPIFH